MNLEIENVVARVQCHRTFDVANIRKTTEADKDVGVESAKFMYEFQTNGYSRYTVVNVFATGRITCTGANTLKKAKMYTERVLELLGVSKYEYEEIYIVMAGNVGRLDIDGLIPEIEKSYIVEEKPDMMNMTIVRNDSVFLTFHKTDPTKVVARGPSEKVIRDSLEQILAMSSDGA